jgi:rSAM/selenodomain-associated transferase 2
MTISIIIPVLNEAESIGVLLQQLTTAFSRQVEFIVVDGGSNDHTLAIVSQYKVRVIETKRGRAKQMNVGAAVASGEILLFLHGDTRFSEVIDEFELKQAILSGCQWGFFKVKLSGQHWIYRVIEVLINLRSRLSSIATGDQCIFVVRDLFEKLKGFKDIPLMEDIELSSRLKRQSKPHLIKQAVITSSRRWETNGIIATILLMWRLRFLYFIGVSPEKLAKSYLR